MTGIRSNCSPRPQPPVRPDDDKCCHGGCEPCIFELYQEALERYRAELRAWEESASKGKQ